MWRWRVAQGAEIRWWKRYLKNKPVKEYLDWKSNYWNSFLNTHSVKTEKDEVVLDAGCGPAGVFMVLNAKEIVAMDPLLDKYEIGLEHFSRAWYPHVKFTTNSFESLDDANRFDQILCFNAINHVSDLKLSLANLYGSLKSGGVCYMSTDAHRWNILRRIFSILPGDVLHPQQYNSKQYLDLFESTGFQVASQHLIKREGIFDYLMFVLRKK